MACRKHLDAVWQQSLDNGGADKNILDSLTILEARPGWVKTSFKIQKKHINEHGSVHGGVMCTLTDTVTWLAMASKGTPAPAGVSNMIQTEFIKPAGGLGDEVIAIGECEQLGRRLAFMKVKYYSKDKLVAYGTAQLMVTNNMRATFSEDGEREIPLPARAKL